MSAPRIVNAIHAGQLPAVGASGPLCLVTRSLDPTGTGRTKWAQRLLELGKPPQTAVACIKRAATACQRVTRLTLRELALPGGSPAITNPAVIGPTVSLLPPSACSVEG